MPEGPEIHRIGDELNAVLAGQILTDIFFAHSHLKKFQQLLKQQQVLGVEAHGKALLTRLDNGLSIYSHNQLYGRWMITGAGQQPDSNRQLRLVLHTQKHSCWLYSASDIEVLKEKEISSHPYLRQLGPDLLHEHTTLKTVQTRLSEPQFQGRQLGALLTDQKVLAGMGNYLRCEALFITGLHPKMRLADLSKSQHKALASACFKLTRQSYKTGGITNELKFAKQQKRQGMAFEDYRFYVFRREGLPCYQCGTPILKETRNGQACYRCPSCQPTPK